MYPNNNDEGSNLLPKTNGVPLFRRVKDVTIFIALVELMFLLLFILVRCYFLALSYLKMTGECARGISAFLTSTRFVFVLGNVIIIALYVIGGRCPPKDDEPSSDDNVYVEEYGDGSHFTPPPPPPPHTVVEEKEAEYVHPCNVPCVDKEVITSHTQSERIARPKAVHAAARRRRVRRRVGVVYGSKDYSVSASASDSVFASAPYRRYEEDDMTGEEFRQKVENYIARQRRLLREEWLSGA